jgi:hypothetical protein
VPGPASDTSASERLRSLGRNLRWDISTVRRGRRIRKRWPWPPEAIAARQRYRGRLEELAAEEIECDRPVPLDVFSFSSSAHLPEQAASIRSFLTHAGEPISWTVVSDGSHSTAARRLLGRIHTCVSVTDWFELGREGLPRVLWDYARVDRPGKKLIALVSLPGDRPVLYTDADVLYFAGAHRLNELAHAGGPPRYISDHGLRRGGPLGQEFALDGALLRDRSEGVEEVNSGFLVVDGPLDWAPALHRLARRRWKPNIFTEQTVVHLTLRRAGCVPLDPAHYVLTADDRWQADDPYLGPESVLRHYVTPVRHKLWLRLARYGLDA